MAAPPGVARTGKRGKALVADEYEKQGFFAEKPGAGPSEGWDARHADDSRAGSFQICTFRDPKYRGLVIPLQ